MTARIFKPLKNNRIFKGLSMPRLGYAALIVFSAFWACIGWAATEATSFQCPGGEWVVNPGTPDCPTNISNQQPGDDLTGNAVNSQATLSQTGGTLYVCVHQSSAADPSCAQVLAGTDGDDAACVSAKNTSIAATTEVFSGADRHTGLVVQTEYKASFCAVRNGKMGRVRTTAPFSTQPISVADLGVAGKYFRVDGVDTFLTGVTMWHSFQALTTGQMDTLLAQVAADGFQVVQGPILLNRATGLVFPQAGPDDYTKLGQANSAYPFTALSSSSFTLNETYWSHVDHWIDQAGAEGLLVVVTPVWGPMIDEIFSTYSNYLSFVEAIAQRYSDCAHCIWQVAGEYQKLAWQTVANDDTELSAAELQLLNDAVDTVDANKSPNTLTAFHPDGQTSTAEDWENDARIDYLALQSYQSTNHSIAGLATDFASSSGKPVWQMEVSYEDQIIGAGPGTVTPWEVRMGAYHSFLGGAAAYSYGNTDMWDDSSNPIAHITDAGYVDITDHFIPFANSYHKVVPNHALVVAGQGSSADGTDTYISAAIYGAAEGILAYTSKGNTFSLNTLAALGAGTLTAEWINPRDGTTSSAGTPASGSSVEFNPPGSPAEDNDYILRVYVGAPVAGGTDLTGKCRVVDSVNGNDNNTGATPAQAWKTLNKVNQSVSTIGEDVCLMDDSVWTGEKLLADWGGTSTDPARIMGVYVDEGDGNKLVQYNVGTGLGRGARPTIQGSLTQACIDNNNCDWTYTNTACGGIYDSLVRVTKSYMHLHSLVVEYSACAGIGIAPTSGPSIQDGAIVGNKVENVLVTNTGMNALLAGRGAKNVVVRDSEFSHYNKCEQSSRRGGTSAGIGTCVAGGGSGWPGGLMFYRSRNVDGLIENNYVHHGYGEGINLYGVSGVVVRYNTVANTHSGAIYQDNGLEESLNVIESNLLVGTSTDDTGAGAGTNAWAFGGSYALNSENVNYTDFNRGLFRNNFVVNGNSCFETGMWSIPDSELDQVEHKSYGNTCIATDGRTIDFSDTTGSDHWSPGDVAAKSNIWWVTNAGSADKCQSGADMDYNLRPGTVPAACRGPNDVESTAPLLGATYATFDAADASNLPSVDDFRLQAGSPAIGAGDPALDTEVCITDTSKYTYALSQMETGYVPSAANFAKCLYYDYEGTVRHATAPDAGALEYAP